MKKITFIILTFVSSSCFAIDQKLIDGAAKYDAAIENMEKIEFDIKLAQRSLEYWRDILNKNKNNQYALSGIAELEQTHIDETNKQISALSIQYSEAKEVVKKYEQIKKKYDKQVKKEREREELQTIILNTIGIYILPLSAFTLLIWFMISRHKKLKYMLNEGKITREEYDRMTQCKSHTYGNCDTNSATGLTMIGGVDSGGNPRGCSFANNSTFDINQDYRDRHRWD